MYDVTPDEEPLDMAAVSDDDALVELLSRSLSPEAAVVWDDDDELDPAFALLRALQQDVSADLPDGAALPAGATPLLGRPRRFGRTATIAAVTAGILSIGGVAAAASPAGSPLGGVRSAVASAVSNVVEAITPDSPVGPTVAAPPADKPSRRATPPGELVSAAARSAAVGARITRALDRAERLLIAKQYAGAKAQLDAAARQLPLVADVAAQERLATRLATLRARLAAPRPADGSGRTGDDARSHDENSSDSQRRDSKGRGDDAQQSTPAGSTDDRSGSVSGRRRTSTDGDGTSGTSGTSGSSGQAPAVEDQHTVDPVTSGSGGSSGSSGSGRSGSDSVTSGSDSDR